MVNRLIKLNNFLKLVFFLGIISGKVYAWFGGVFFVFYCEMIVFVGLVFNLFEIR